MAHGSKANKSKGHNLDVSPGRNEPRQHIVHEGRHGVVANGFGINGNPIRLSTDWETDADNFARRICR
jgi:hypothetical protein